ncbi:Calx-beta domain-containing protein [Floridanema evergladense]|uniref:Calx-beta domain-containing protein n=1 Tax=Floridaenema evergladense BLCC-F167 TaxID=3153639 RepID=A0ABV4WLH0_9CYAN
MATIIGTPGNDFLKGTIDADLILGLAGNDTELGLEGRDSLFGNEGQDFLFGGPGNDLINGNQGNDVGNGNEDNDSVYGGAGNDEVRGGKGNDLLFGDLGNDSIFGDLDNDTIFGGFGFDFLSGNAGNDVINGNEDNDTIFGVDGNDSLYGGQGNDFVVGDTGLDTIFGNLGNDTLYGGEDDDYINGNEGDDFLSGNDGNDTVFGGQGNDSIFGGKDNDRLFGDKGKDTIFGNLGRDSILGGEDDDFLNGNQDRDTIFGGQGNDSILGGEDDDLLYGDKGNDTVFGNLGNDSVFGGAGADFLNGNEGDDTLNGNEDNDTVYGGQGNDIVRGGKGNDSLFGDKGSDTIYGDIGADTLTGNSGDTGTADLFVIGLTGDPTNKTTGGLTVADADLITDWDLCIDQISLTGGLSFDDLVLAQGTGANAANTIVSISSSFKGNGAGEFLSILKNVNASSIDGTSFIDSNGKIGPARPIIVATDGIAIEPITTPNGTLENNGEFTVLIPCKADSDLAITYTVTSTGTGVATPGVDYQTLSGTVVIPKGSDRATIPVIPIGDTVAEGPETVTLTLTPKGTGFVSGTPQSATVTILDAVVTNKPIVFVTAPQPTTKEGTGPAGSFQFARTGGDITQPLTINYTVAGTATPGVDYNPTLSGTITIGANQTVSTQITITALGDSTIEPTETVVVSTKQDSNYIVGSQSTAAVSILEANPLVAPPAGRGPIVRYNSSGTLQPGDYTTFTAAVTASNDNDIIVAQPGTYNEPGAVAINKPLTVRGSNAGLSPGSGSLGPQSIVNGVSGQPVFAVNTNQPVTIEGLTIKGNATDQNLIQGNISNTGLVIRQNQFTGTGPSNGGVIRADFSNSTGSLTIVDNLIRDVQTTGGSVTSAIQAFRINNVTITDNVIANLTGPGIVMDSITGQGVVINNSVSNLGEYGIQLAGGNATISNNNITNVVLGPDLTPNTGDEDLTYGGIRLRNSGFNPATSTLGTVNVTSNVITNSVNAFVIRPLQAGDPAAAAVTVPNTVKVNQNNFIGNAKSGLLNGGTGGTLDATNNWWGVPTGPVVGGTGQNAITGVGAGSVTFIPFASAPF